MKRSTSWLMVLIPALAVSLAVTAFATAEPSAQPPSDGPDTSIRTRTSTSEPAGTGPGVASAALPTCFTDPSGDVLSFDDFEEISFPKADILEWCVTYGNTDTSVSMRLAQNADPSTDPGWVEGFTAASWDVDVNGDELQDFWLLLFNDGASVRFQVVTCTQSGFETTCTNTPDRVPCEVAPTWSESGYMATFATNCIGSPAQIRMQATMQYDDNGSFYEDMSPDDGYTPPISMESGAPPPSPPPPSEPPGTGRPVLRLAGPGRIETAVAISQFQFPNGAQEVYLARSDNFPDALAGGALTGGPILLVPSCGDLPAAVRDEIRRLNPARIVALGGSSAVCDSILAQAANA